MRMSIVHICNKNIQVTVNGFMKTDTVQIDRYCCVRPEITAEDIVGQLCSIRYKNK